MSWLLVSVLGVVTYAQGLATPSPIYDAETLNVGDTIAFGYPVPGGACHYGFTRVRLRRIPGETNYLRLQNGTNCELIVVEKARFLGALPESPKSGQAGGGGSLD